ncbi:facilitated trehalose transporter Tret1-like [Onthophagus taurus]|uniref:facilitated trehalose transporter Tret1-like n=1 Tax=Onthophagus taurus TaxID=166361 RepID=UPI0039BDC176
MIVGELKIQDVDTPKQWPQYVACTAAALSITAGATQFSWASPSIPKLLEPEYGLSIEQASYIPLIEPIAMFIFSPIYSKLMDVVGRKQSLLHTGVALILAWLFLIFSKNLICIYITKVFSGIADACYLSILPVYIAEVSVPNVRDGFGNILMVMLFGGQFIINCVGYYADIQLTACIMLSLPILFMVTFIFMPESPYYCIMKKDYQGARKSLKFLRRIENVDPELEQLKRDIERQLSESGTFKDLFMIKSNRKAVYIANITRMVQQVSGLGTFAMYAQLIFQQAGGEISSGVATMIFTAFLTVSNFYSRFFTTRLGKKMAMVYSSIGCGLALLSESIYFFLDLHTSIDVSSISWFPVLGLVVYVCLTAIGLGPIPNVILGEIFSASIKKKAMTISNMIFAIYLMAFPKIFQLLMTNFSLFVPFTIYAVCTLLGAIACYFMVPDTTGKTLEEIQQMLKGSD